MAFETSIKFPRKRRKFDYMRPIIYYLLMCVRLTAFESTVSWQSLFIFILCMEMCVLAEFIVEIIVKDLDISIFF